MSVPLENGHDILLLFFVRAGSKKLLCHEAETSIDLGREKVLQKGKSDVTTVLLKVSARNNNVLG